MREGKPLLEKISKEAMPLDDSLVSFQGKRRWLCSEKMSKLQCSLLKELREFRRKIWQSGKNNDHGRDSDF